MENQVKEKKQKDNNKNNKPKRAKLELNGSNRDKSKLEINEIEPNNKPKKLTKERIESMKKAFRPTWLHDQIDL